VRWRGQKALQWDGCGLDVGDASIMDEDRHSDLERAVKSREAALEGCFVSLVLKEAGLHYFTLQLLSNKKEIELQHVLSSILASLPSPDT
jgi:hypothetical protein